MCVFVRERETEIELERGRERERERARERSLTKVQLSDEAVEVAVFEVERQHLFG